MSDDFITKDSGERRVFETGSVRDSRKGKGRFDLIPAYPLKRLAQLYERGAEKYADNNWQKGQPLANYLDSAMRHMNDYREGDRAEDHLIAVAWNVFAYIWTERAIEQGKLPASLGAVEVKAPAPTPAVTEKAADAVLTNYNSVKKELLSLRPRHEFCHRWPCAGCTRVQELHKMATDLEAEPAVIKFMAGEEAKWLKEAVAAERGSCTCSPRQYGKCTHCYQVQQIDKRLKEIE